ncbi:MAG: acyl-CoA carboxylase subunit beta [Candidatus Schekmanbacteria bacterium]|nr:acyl-CoA carboxylase subunit beta [Candidatus Schekmanbacteria bacterium]
MSRRDDLFKALAAANAAAALGGGESRIARQHEQGKLTARERIDLLLDHGSFEELDRFVTHRCSDFDMQDRVYLGDGVVTGHGTVDGRRVFLFAQDFTVFGGSLSEAYAEKICKIMDHAMSVGAPVVGLNDSGGARIQEGVVSLAGYAEIFLRNTIASGVVPQISAILGPCAGGAVYSPAITDFVIMVKESSHMFITGPEVIRTVTHEEVSFEELGGAVAHSTRSGVAHFACAGEREAIWTIRQLLSYLPSNNLEDPPRRPTEDSPERRAPELNEMVPASATKPYDMRDIIRKVADDGVFFEIQEDFARNLVIGFCHLGGQSVGVVANQPLHLAGTLDIDASIKGARFVRCCDAFNVPLVVFEDVPGFLPGVTQEHGGIIKHGAKLLYAFAEATVPRITVVTRKSYGGAYCVMNSKQIRADVNLAYPTAEIAVMGPEGAVNVLYRKEIAAAPDPDALRAKLVEEFRSKLANPWVAAGRGYIDEVIVPADTRPKLIRSLRMLAGKRRSLPPKKHGNIPL